MGDYLNDQSKNTSESWCPRCASLECASCVAGWRQRATEMGCQTSDTKATRSLPCADAALGQAVQPTSVRPDRSPIGIIVRASVELRALLAVLAAQSEWLCSRRLLFCWTIQARSRLGECAAPSFGSRPKPTATSGTSVREFARDLAGSPQFPVRRPPLDTSRSARTHLRRLLDWVDLRVRPTTALARFLPRLGRVLGACRGHAPVGDAPPHSVC